MRLLVLFFLLSFSAQAAQVNSVSNYIASHFGTAVTINNQGTITTKNTGDCETNNSIEILIPGTCEGSFNVRATPKDTDDNNRFNNDERNFRVFLTGNSNISNGASTIDTTLKFDPLPSICKSKNGGTRTVLECTLPNSSNSIDTIFTIYGKLQAIDKFQETGSYNTNYTITVCECNHSGCPNSPCATSGVNASGMEFNGSFGVIIYRGISIDKNSDLDFGDVAPSKNSSGTITINKNGIFTTTGGVESLSSSVGTAGRFTISGTRNIPYTLSYQNSTIQLSDGSNSMNLDLSFAFESSDVAYRFNNSGTQVVYTTGTLNVGANQPDGIYTGTYSVTAHY